MLLQAINTFTVMERVPVTNLGLSFEVKEPSLYAKRITTNYYICFKYTVHQQGQRIKDKTAIVAPKSCTRDQFQQTIGE